MSVLTKLLARIKLQAEINNGRGVDSMFVSKDDFRLLKKELHDLRYGEGNFTEADDYQDVKIMGIPIKPFEAQA